MKVRRVAFVSVDRDEQDAQRFWSAVLDALRGPAATIDPQMQPAALTGLDGDQLVDMVRSELDQAERLEPVVLIVDDLHELRSAEALAQLERLLAVLPSSARVVLSSRRDPPIRLHRLRLADEVAEIRASRSAVHRARDARAPGWVQDQLVRGAGWPRCTSARKVGRLACAWR